MINKAYTATITERLPDNGAWHGSVAWKLVEWVEPEYDVPCYELYKAEFSVVEDEPADLENGPSASLELGPWTLECSGVGVATIDELVARLQEEVLN